MQTNPFTIFFIFLRLGLTSFGGPAAHLGYFRDAFVARRKWLDEPHYADLIALCQFVPGPASSQAAFAIGLLRGGHLGALAASLGFTLPSALLMAFAAYGLQFTGGPVAQGVIHGLKIVAVAVVAQAVLGMWRALCPDAPRASIAIVAAAALLTAPAPLLQLAVIAAGAAAGALLLKTPPPQDRQDEDAGGPSKMAGIAAFALFAALLLGLPFAAGGTDGALAIFAAFYQAGALVFGGGHVVLPLLEDAFVRPGWVTQEAFLAGYGAAQALPGPLFSFAAYLGAIAPSGIGPAGGAALGVAAIFLPGLLLIYAALPFWNGLRRSGPARAALSGVNAAVVGVLAAALYDPIFTVAIKAPPDLAAALLALAALTLWRAPVILIVAACAAAGVFLAPGA